MRRQDPHVFLSISKSASKNKQGREKELLEESQPERGRGQTGGGCGEIVRESLQRVWSLGVTEIGERGLNRHRSLYYKKKLSPSYVGEEGVKKSVRKRRYSASVLQNRWGGPEEVNLREKPKRGAVRSEKKKS